MPRPVFDVGQDQNEDDLRGAVNELIASQLANHRTRGKDHNNVCPLGSACDKNGKNADGSLKVFDRNSAFR